MKAIQLKAQKREITGKKVRHLRKQGIIPLNLYGKKISSQSLQTPLDTFIEVNDKAGTTALIDVIIEGSTKKHHALIQTIQYHPITDEVLHADLKEVPLKEKIEVSVPVTLTGESEIVEKGQGVLMQIKDELNVESLPTEIPEEIIADISSLTEVGSEIVVKDLPKKEGYTFADEEDTTIVRIAALQKEEEVETTAEEPEEAEEATENKETPSEEASEGESSQEESSKE